MLRAVLALLVVAAILAVSQPVLQQGRQEHATTMLAAEVDGLLAEARDLVATDEAVDGAGARRIVTLELPDSRRISTGGGHVELAGGDPSSVTWAVGGGRTHRRLLTDLRLRPVDGERLLLEGAGDHRLVLGLRGPVTEPTVSVQRFEPPIGGPDA